MAQLALIVHNVRSAHNAGSLLRTADGLGVSEVYLSGYTPYPKGPNDSRLPHLADKADRAISKTALGAEKSVRWRHIEQLEPTISKLRQRGFRVLALEQAAASVPLDEISVPDKIALIVGSEVGGLDSAELSLADQIVEIPMYGSKESFNVAVAAAIALYALGYR